MSFRAEVYKAAALEHAEDARVLFSARRYALAHYVAGLSVECLFLAYKARLDPHASLRRDHNLRELAREGGIYSLVPSSQQAQIGSALGVVLLRWRNNHRYRSEEALRRFLKESGLDRRVKGDYLLTRA